MLTIADIPLVLPTPPLVRWIRDNVDPQYLPEFHRRSWPGPTASQLGYPLQNEPITRVEINRLHWFTRHTRFGYGHFLCSTRQAEQIAAVAFGTSGLEQNLVTLKMDATGQQAPETLAIKVYCLPPKPLSVRIPETAGTNSYINGLQLITVVDPSYYHWDYSCPPLPISAGTSWADVIALIAAKLGITFPIDTIESDYQRPNKSLHALQGEAIPPVLDTVLFNIQQRFIRQYDNTYRATDWQTAFDAQEAADNSAINRTIRAGADLFSTADPLLEYNISPILPKFVEIAFPCQRCAGDPTDVVPDFYTVRVPSSDYTTFACHADAKVFKDRAVAIWIPGNTVPSNASLLDAIAREIAEDYLSWRQSFGFDRVYNGILNITPTGYTDSIEWTYRAREHPRGDWVVPQGEEHARFVPNAYDAYECTTRVRTQTYNWEPESLHHAAGDCTPVVCGPPEHQRGNQTCQTAYQIDFDTKQLVSVGVDCCVTVCCSSSSSSSTSNPDGCPTVNCGKCHAVGCQVTFETLCIEGGIACFGGLIGSCAAELGGGMTMFHVPGHNPTACVWHGCHWAAGQVGKTCSKPITEGTLYHNGNGWQVDLLGPCNHATFNSVDTNECFFPGMVMKLGATSCVPDMTCSGIVTAVTN